MNVFLAKLLPLFAYPLGLAIVLAALSLGLALLRFRRSAFASLTLSLAILWVASMPAFANWLGARLEGQYPPVPIADLPQADVAIVLGGIVGQPLPPRIAPDLGEPADRVVHAVRLFRAGKVGNVLVTGGNLPWQNAVAPEANLIADLLVEFGVPRQAIAIETESRNTYENAINSAAIFRNRGWKTAFLVTSAAHMPRALAAFKHAGIDAMPASTDVRVRFPLYDSALDFMPDAGALERTSNAVREWIGLAVYRVRGWA